MSRPKAEQIASIRVGYCEFKIIVKTRNDWRKEYWLYRCESELKQDGVHKHRTLDGKYEFYGDALKTVAYCAERYHFYGRVPTPEEI